jgi:hypothetical protein
MVSLQNVDKTYILVVDTSTFQFLVTSCAIAFSKGSFSATVLQVGDKEKCIEPVFFKAIHVLCESEI